LVHRVSWHPRSSPSSSSPGWYERESNRCQLWY